MKKKMLFVSDLVIFRCGQKTYTTSPWISELTELYGQSIAKLTIIGRVRELTCPQNNLCEVDVKHVEIIPVFDFKNPLQILFPVNFWRSIGVIVKAIRDNDVLFLKLFYFYSAMAFLANWLLYKKPVATILVGDSAQAALYREDYIKLHLLRLIASRLIFRTILFIQNRVDQAGYVSQYLLSKYQPHHTNSIVANESVLREWMYLKDKKVSRSGYLRVLFVGRMVKVKGVELLIEALIELLQENYPIKAVFIGEGPLTPSLRLRVEEYGLGHAIAFKGWLPSCSQELISQYRNTDVLVLPSFSEGLPLVILEAMANKCAVIAMRVAGVPEIVIQEKTGLLISAGSKIELKQALIKFVDNPRLATEYGEAGFQLSQRHSFSEQRGRFARQVKQLILMENPLGDDVEIIEGS